MGQIVRAIDGMAEACRELDFPVVSGNVSLYNETNGVAIPPTPTVGAVGLLTNYDVVTGFSTMAEGDTLVLIGETHGELGASIYLREVLGREDGAPPPVDLKLERKTGDFVRGLIEAGEPDLRARPVRRRSDRRGGGHGPGLGRAASSWTPPARPTPTSSCSARTRPATWSPRPTPTDIIAAAQRGRAARLGRRSRQGRRLRLRATCSASRWSTCARCTRRWMPNWIEG